MDDVRTIIDSIDWTEVRKNLDNEGYVLVPNVLDSRQCISLLNDFDKDTGYRKTVVMERYRFGLGTYKYWGYPLPRLVNELRKHLYPKLAPIANVWMDRLNIETCFPKEYRDLQKQCHDAGQRKPTPLILKYEQGGYNTLHQDLYGSVYFPIQAACFLSEPEKDYTGGEFILTEQVPRAQSKAMVLKPRRGDMVIFSTNFRPAKGSRGYHRVTMRHGVSKVRSGSRYALGIIFHDAEK